jgi:hypothetical protein
LGTTTAEKGQYVPLTATVENSTTGAPVGAGVVRFVLDGPGNKVLGTTRLNKHGATTFTRGNFTRLGVSLVHAMYIPSSGHYVGSQSAAQGVNVVPATVTSFAITSDLYRSHPGKPVTFTVTALGPNHKPITNYTGVVQISTPTDNQTVYPASFYVNLGLSAPSPVTTDLANIPNPVYQFKPSDHGMHTFVGGITFNKGGAQILMVTQTNNMYVYGKATYGIA